MNNIKYRVKIKIKSVIAEAILRIFVLLFPQ